MRTLGTLSGLGLILISAGYAWAQNPNITGPARRAAGEGAENLSAPRVEQRMENRQERRDLRRAGAPIADPNAAFRAGANVTIDVPDRWRYVQHNNQWWYYTPENRWMYYDNNAWNNYVVPSQPPRTFAPGGGAQATIRTYEPIPDPNMTFRADANVNVPDGWRYVQRDNRWWYYTPENRWMYYDNNAWSNYVPNTYGGPRYTTGYRGPYDDRGYYRRGVFGRRRY